jgi:hypothetical protein
MNIHARGYRLGAGPGIDRAEPRRVEGGRSHPNAICIGIGPVSGIALNLIPERGPISWVRFTKWRFQNVRV